jgi:hypothetical protein
MAVAIFDTTDLEYVKTFGSLVMNPAKPHIVLVKIVFSMVKVEIQEFEVFILLNDRNVGRLKN